MKTEGSLINRLMECNQTMPVVGKGGTHIQYSDRDAFEVLSVSPDNKSCVIQFYKHERTDSNGMSETQSYKYETTEGPLHTLILRKNGWYKMYETITMTSKFLTEVNTICLHLEGEEREIAKSKYRSEVYNENMELQLVKGKTHVKKNYDKFPVIFGVKQTYYDYSF
jgi:hypothetical protein